MIAERNAMSRRASQCTRMRGVHSPRRRPDSAGSGQHGQRLGLLAPPRPIRSGSRASGRFDKLIEPSEDHILIVDPGPEDKVEVRIESLRDGYEAPKRQAAIV